MTTSQDLRRARQAQSARAMCRREERILQPHTDAKKRLQVQARGMLETAAKKIKIVRPGGNVMVIAPDLDRAKIDAHSLHAV